MNYRDFFKREAAAAGKLKAQPDLKNVDQNELEMGVKVEMEHTTDEATAKTIAMHHLAEDPKYYTHMKSAGLKEDFADVSGLPKRDGALDIPHLGQPIHMAKIINVGALGAAEPASGELSGYTNVVSQPGDKEKITAAGKSDPVVATKSVGGPVTPGEGQKQDGPNTKGKIADTPSNPSIEGGEVKGGDKGLDAHVDGAIGGTPKNVEIQGTASPDVVAKMGACVGAPPAEDVSVDLMEGKKARSILNQLIQECMNELCYDEETGMWKECINEGKHKPGCKCAFCKNKGSFGKKKDKKEDKKDDKGKKNPFASKGKKEKEEMSENRLSRMGAKGAGARLDINKIVDVEMDGIDMHDYPEFSDAYVSRAWYPAVPNPRTGKPEDWRELTDDELDWLNSAPEAREFVYNHGYESAINRSVDESGWERRNPDQPSRDPLGLVGGRGPGVVSKGLPVPAQKCKVCGKLFKPQHGEYSRCPDCLGDQHARAEHDLGVQEASYKVVSPTQARCSKCDHARRVQTEPKVTEQSYKTQGPSARVFKDSPQFPEDSVHNPEIAEAVMSYTTFRKGNEVWHYNDRGDYVRGEPNKYDRQRSSRVIPKDKNDANKKRRWWKTEETSKEENVLKEVIRSIVREVLKKK